MAGEAAPTTAADSAPGARVLDKVAAISPSPAVDAAAAPAVLTIEKPQAGQTQVLHVSDGQRLGFGFSLDSVKIELRDVDLVVTFADGSSVVLLEFGVRLLAENAAQLIVDGKPIDAQALLAMVSNFVASDVPIQANMTSQEAPKPLSQQAEKAEQTPPPPAPQPVVVEVQAEPVKRKDEDAPPEKNEHKADQDSPAPLAPPARPVTASDEGSSSSKKADPVETNTHTSDNPDPPNTNTGIGPGLYNVPVPEISAKLLGVVASTVQTTGSIHEIDGALAQSPADTDTRYAVQAQVDTITGTTGNDLIYADNPIYAGVGTSTRTVELNTVMPNSDWVITGLRVSGLPEGYSIVGASRVDGSYVVAVDPLNPNVSSIKLQYVLPDGTTTANAAGFYGFLTLKLDYDITSPTYGAAATTSGTIQFGVRDVAGEADAVYLNPVTGAPIYVLWSTPPGTIVHAGAGDDTVVAGAGKDVLDGGSGTDMLSYKMSNAAVSVDLAANAASGGYAKGDTISGFESVEGSAHADTLSGDAGANTLIGGAGADVLDGRGGTDTARYDGSADGVVVDLVAGTGQGGDAQGDVLTSIENLYGSAFADRLVGDAGDNELHGGAGNDVLIGAAGADLLDGGEGVDTADYSAGTQGIAVDLAAGVGSAGDAAGDRLVSIETVIGTAFDDTIAGSAAAETLSGGAGDDRLDGRGGDDILQGGAGDDILTGGAGADVLNGGAGNDTASYAASAAGVSVSLTTGTASGGDAAGDTLISIENLTGSGLDDVLVGNGDANVLRGGDGGDQLRGGAGADVLDGGLGSDIADYSTSSGAVTVNLALGTASGGDAQGDTLISIENVIGSTMADTLIGDAGSNALSGGAGDDLLVGGGGADALAGGAGIDTASYAGSVAAVEVDLTAGTAHGGDAEGDTLDSVENVVGSDFDDTLRGDAAANALSGGAGDDLLIGGAGADTLDGGAGTDTASYAGSALGVSVDLATGYGQSGDAAGDRLTGIENLVGSDQADTLRGDAGVNALHGGAGDDTLLGGGGADVLDGGTGFDTISYAGSAAAVTVDLGSGSASGGDAAGDTLTSIEAVIGSDFDDTLKAGATAAALAGGLGDDTLTGGASADSLSGGAGDDLLIGGGGADRLDGGSGADTASYADSAAGVSVDLASGSASGGDAAGDTLTSIENVIGSSRDDVLIGSAAANVLQGGQGDDTLIGGAGADTLDGGSGFDIADYGTSGFGVTINLATGANGGGDAQGDTLLSIEKIIGSAFADTMTGGAGDDIFAGGAGDDTLSGAAGNDRLEGGDGNDLLTGGTGNDVLIGGDGTDTASYAGSQAAVQVDLAAGTGLGGDAAGDTLSGIENLVGSDFDDVLIGDAGANTLSGGTGNDRLEGGAGNDNLIGGSGNDILIGGAGADVFQGGDGSDTVDYSTSASGVGVNLATRSGVGGDAEGDGFFDIENVTGSGHDDILTGNGGANVVTGGAGNDVIDAGAGDDTVDAGAGDDVVTGGAGADTLHGGAGTDILSYALSSAAVAVDLQLGTGLGGDAQGDVVDGFEELQGSAFADSLLGTSANDILRGGAGDDILRGRGGADVLDGGAGIDTADYADSASAVHVDLDAGTASGGDAQGDTLISIERAVGSAHDDWLKAAASGSTLDGGGGDDMLVAGAGADTLSGGAGRDTVDYTASTAAVVVNLATGTGSGGSAEGDTLSGIEDVLGSAHADTLVGNAGANALTGGAGDDTLAGLGGADTLDGGAGFDTLDYSASNAGVTIDFASGTGTGGDAQGDSFTGIEAVRGSALSDRIIGDGDAHSIFGQGGDDTVVAGAGADLIDGGSGLDTVDYSASNAAVSVDLGTGAASGGYAAGDTLASVEAVVGTAYDDTLIGSAGVNLLSGGAGSDLVRGGAGSDVLDGGAGIDTLDYSTSTAGVTVDLAAGTAIGGDATGDTISNFENVLGSGLADRLTGDAGTNLLTGGAGDDVLAGLAGADTLDGGSGFDIADYSASAAAVTIDLGAGTASGGDGSGDTLISIEGVVGSAFADRLTGSNGIDRLDGGAGDDTLLGSLGADQLIGGAGSDTADYSASTAGVTVALDGSAGVGGDAEGDTLTGIENLTGSALADRLTGDSYANILRGGDGNDVLDGAAGDDGLYGGAGDDVLAGGSGADLLDGGAGFDTADYTMSGAALVADLETGVVSGGDGTGDTLVSIERLVGTIYGDRLTAAAAGSTLEGGAGDDTLIGAAGADTLLGGDGNDLVTGGAGADILDGGNGADTVSYAGSGAGVTVDLGLATAQAPGGDAEGDVLSNFESAIGSAFADMLSGTAGTNTLTGGAGDDILAGLGGADTLDGGAGNDTADYSASGGGVTVNLSNNQNFGGDAAGDTLVSIENVTGSALADTLTGDAGANILKGGAGDDVLAGLGGADVLDGGAGSNTADYSASAVGVNVNLAGNFAVATPLGTIAAGGAGLGGDAEGDTYLSIQNLIGSGQDDVLAAHAAGGRLSGGAGNDTLVANAGADTLDGGAGTDTVDYGHSNAAVTVDLSTGLGSGGYAQGDTLTGIEAVSGSSYGDTLTGSFGANTLSGLAGDDLIEGLGGADTLDGGAGTDTVSYAHSVTGVTVDLRLATAQVSAGDASGDILSNFENILGSAFSDTLTGDANGNVLTGGAGDDVLAGLGGADTLDGGAGSDTASYAASAAAVTVNLSTGAASGGDATGDTLTSIENLIGSALDDTLTGDAGGNLLSGGAGNDVLAGLGGADTLDGGAGTDTANYAASAAGVTVNLSTNLNSGGDAAGDILVSIESVTGSNLADVLTGAAGANSLSGGGGDDVLAGLGGADTLDGGAGSDTADYSASAAAVTVDLATGAASGGDAAGDTLISIENVIGSTLGDTLTAAAAGSRLSGGGGNDTLRGGAGVDTLDGGVGTDTADYSASSAGITVNLATGVNTGGDADGDTLTGIENVTGSASADTLVGDASANVLTGGAGDDILIGGAGADTLDGGAGSDTADYSASGLAVAVNLTTGVGSGGNADGDTLIAIENVTGSAFDDRLTGDAGANTLKGGAGDDILAGMGGADVLDGGAGSNTVDYSDSAARVVVNLTNAAQSPTGIAVAALSGVQGDAAGDTYVNIQNAIGSAFDDLILASNAGGRIQGGAGNDALYAGSSADILDGGAGSDTASYALSTAAVTVNLSTGAASGGFATGDSLIAIENLTGSQSYGDVLTGSAVANVIDGRGGNDTIEGLGGADTLDGGAGVDTVTYANSAQGVTVSLALATAQVSAGDAAGDILSNFENLTGSAHDDALTGDANANIIAGGAGDDVLQGGAGADTLDGGSGSNTASYAGSTVGVSVDLGLAGAQVSTGDADGDVLISIESVVGSALADTLTGSAADNRLSGGAGDDLLVGLGGADDLDGGDGVDTADYSASAEGVTVNLTLGTGVGGDAQGDTLRNIENVTGSAYDDILSGDANANMLLGGDGNDTLAGLGGADAIDGGAGNNTVDYSASAAAVTVNLSSTNGAFADAGTGVGGDAQGDTLTNIQNLIGSAYADYIYANGAGGSIGTGAGDDTIVAGAGKDVIDGGAGSDTADYSASTAAVTINLAAKTASGGYAATDVLTNIENITGSTYNDTLTGDGGANTLKGGAGNDTIEGGAGNDTLDGGAGSDTLSYANATSAVRLLPNYYTWTYPNGVQTQTFLAYNTVGAGSDITSNFENIVGSGYSDIINLSYGGLQVSGGAGNDLIYNNGNWGLIDGGAGIDTATFSRNDWWGGVTVNLATDTSTSSRSWGGSATGDWFTGVENLIGSGYNDYLAGDAGINALNGGAGNDWLRGAGGNDVLFGGTGDDLLIGGAGADALIGGTGIDTASWAGSSAGVNASLATGTASGGDAGTAGAATAYANASLVAGWGFAEGSGTTATAISGAQTVTLNGGAGWVAGQAGHGGALNFNGAGSGNYATISSIQAADAFSVSVSLKVDTLNSTNGVWKLGTATGGYFTWLRVNSNGSLTYEVRGDIAGATLTAQSTSSISTAAGVVNPDQWVNVTVTYQAGRLQLFVDGNLMGSTDSAVFLPTGLVWNNSALGYDYRGTGGILDGQIDDFAVFNTALTEAEVQQLATQKTGLESAGLVTDTLSGIENLTGTDHADTLTGDAGDNVLDGGLGNDTLIGGAGSDTLIGGAGADVLDGGSGDDVVSYARSTAAVTVNLADQSVSGGDAQGDTLTSIEGVIGSAKNDTLVASDHGSTLIGGAGNDTLTGGAGGDVIKGDDDLGKLVTYAGTAAAGTNLLINGNFENYTIGRLNGGSSLSASLANGWQTADGTIVITDSYYIANGTAENQSVRLNGNSVNNDIWQNVTTTAGETYLLQFNLGGLTGNSSPVGVYFNGVLLDTLYGGAISQKWATFDYLVTGTGGSDKIEFKYLGTSDQVLLDDVIFTAVGGRDVIDGGAGNDDIDGGFGNDVLRGGEGDDHIVGGLGNDTIDGGAGNDTISGDADALSAPGLETFSNGVNGWTGLNGASTSTATLLDGSMVLGPIGGSGNNANWVQQVQKSYQLTDTSAANTTVSFDLYLLDSFDANEGVKVYVNGDVVLTITAPNGMGGVGSNMSGLTFTTAGGATYTASLTQANYSAAWGGNDDKLTITLTVPTPGPVLTLGFGSNMNESGANESIAIDNVNVPGSGIVGSVGAAGDDVITGGAGDDIIDGGAGNDRAVFSGDRAAYTVTYDAVSQRYSISGPDGSDTVRNVERFTFDDGTLSSAQLVAGLDLTPTATTIAENSAAGTAAGQLAMAGGVAATYAITGGADAALFAINGNTIQLANGASLDHEAAGTRSIQVTATTADGSTHVETVVITVSDVNEAPVITSAAGFSRAENGTVVATLTASDPDVGATKAWSISGADAALFQIDSQTGALSFKTAPNYENPQDAGGDNVYNLTVSVSDGTNVTSQNLAVTVTNVNEAPVLTLTDNGPVTENAVAATVATLSLADPDAGDSVTYTLSGADASLFVVDHGSLRLKDGVSLNYEEASTRSVTVTATDAGGLTSQQSLTVHVADVNEAPVITSAASFSIAENGAAVATLTATDPDAGATRSWSISGTDAALFQIDSTTGALSFKGAPDHEGPQDAGGDNVYDLTVSVSDGTNVTSQNLAVTVTNVNEAPSLTLTGSGAIAENVAAATVATFSASDPDAGTTLTYTLGGADAALFMIDGATVRLKDGVSLDYEQATHRDLTLTVSDGTNSATRALTVSVTDVNEAPTITSAATFSVAENGSAVATLTATDPDAGATRSWSISGADAALFQIDSATGALSFIAAPNAENPQDAGADNVYDLTVSVSDGTNTTSQAVAVTVTNVNEAPSLSLSASGPIAENTVAATVATFAASDQDAGTTLTYTLSGADAALFVVDGNTIRLKDGAAFNYEQATSHTVDLTVSDGTNSVTRSLTITVTDVNEAPAITSAASFSIAENGAAVATLSATDPDAGATKSWSISGTDAALFQINSTTGALSFIAAPNYENPQDAGADNVYNLTVSVSDGTNATSQAVAITVTNVNEAPSLTLTGTGSVSETVAGATVASFAGADPDAGTTLTYTLGGADAALFTIDGNTVRLKDGVSFDYEQATTRSFDLTVSDGTITVTRSLTVAVADVNEAPTITSAAAFSLAENGTAVATMTSTDPDAGATRSWSIAGTDAALFHIDANTGALSFIAAPNYENPQDAGADNVYDLTVSVSDGTNTVSKAVAVTVTNVNDAPVIVSAATAQIIEHTTQVATLAATDQDGDPLTWSIAGGADAARFSIDAATGVLSFASAPSYDSPADAGADNVYDVQVRASDGTVSVVKDIAVTVLRDQQAPTITSAAAFSVAENQSAVATLSASDPNAGDTVTWSIAGGADAAKFAIDASTGALSFVGAPDHENAQDNGANNVYDVVVKAQDQTGLSSTKAVAVTVTNVDEAPVFATAAALSAPEQGTAVATVVASDPERAAVSYSIAGGADQALFTINAQTGELRFVSAQDYQNPGDADHDRVYQVTVRASDGSSSTDRAFSVTLTDVNQAPSFTSAATASVSENVAGVMTVTGQDPDAGTTLTYAISGGADASLFTIDSATGALAFRNAPNFEAPADAGHDNVYDVTVLVSDGSLARTQAIVVTVTDAAEAPTFTSAAAVTVNEGQTAAATLNATDPDAGSTLTYSISGGADAGLFTIDAQTGALRFSSAPDYEAKADANHDNVYDVQVAVSDGGLTTTQAMTVTLVNVAPTITSAATVAMAENSLLATTVSATDPAGGTLVYALAGGADANLFAIDSATGALSFRSAPNYEAPGDAGHDNHYNVTVLVSDGDKVTTQTLDISVTDVNEAPHLAAAATSVTIDENHAGATVTSFTGSDPDQGDHVTYSLSGADAALFEISGQSVKLLDGVSLDFETKSSYAVNLVATDDHGLTTTQALGVLVGDVQGETLVGTTGDDRLVAGIGNDTLEGGAGADQLIGGAGSDTALYNHSGAGVSIDLTAGTAHGGEAEGDTFSGIENLTGSDHDDTLTGDAADNRLIGGAGNDTLDGKGGANFLSGGDGDDILYTTGRGSDTVQGGAGQDTVHFTDPGSVVLTGLSGIEDLDFRNGGNDTVSLDGATLYSLAPAGNILTINRDAGDNVSFSNSVNQNSQFTDGAGIIYDVYTMQDDHQQQVTVHLQHT